MSARWLDVETALGTVIIADDGEQLTVEFSELHPEPPIGRRDPSLRPELAKWILASLQGPVDAPPLPLAKATPFRRACWAACRTIPCGQTRTYGELAAMAGNPKAARAAGTAMRTNPVALVTPCHRVVATGGPGGYAGRQDASSPHLQLKGRLLELERQIAARSQAP
jgi:O-6-methylguanine DNA methyltransferase